MAKRRKRNSGIPIQPGFVGKAIITKINDSYGYSALQGLKVGDVVKVVRTSENSISIIPTWNQYYKGCAWNPKGDEEFRTAHGDGWFATTAQIKLNKVRF